MNPSEGAAPGRSKSLFVKSYRDFSAAAEGASRPTEEEGKFVVLSKGKGIHVVLSPVSLTPYHANIVYQYLQAEGRGEVEAVSSSGCRILSKGWKVHGGGYYTVQHWLHNLILHGKSTAFGKYEARVIGPHAESIAEQLGLSGYGLEFK
jgi:hypothetical protein